MDDGIFIFGLIVAAGLAFIPASIAKKKGYSFGLWWLYGWLLFIVAIIHVTVIPNKNEVRPHNAQNPQGSAPAVSVVTNHSAADELKKYKDLLDSGVITQEEFAIKKEQLLKLI